MNKLWIAIAILTLVACTTVSDFASDMGIETPALGAATSESLITQDSCPAVEIVDDLGMLYEFTDEKNPSAKTLISSVDITSATSTCDFGTKSVTMDVKVDFLSTIGPKGRLSSSDRPFFSYPFFVAVVSPSGNILAKEVFAASMTYAKDQTAHEYHEELRQIIPVKSRYNAAKHKIMIGFQATSDQLAYNRALILEQEQQRAAMAKAKAAAAQLNIDTQTAP